MNTLSKSISNSKKAFTLIELIIGITILAILAVALLAALDPVEQFAKSRDTATRNTAIELHNAVVRYAASREEYPGGFNNPSAATIAFPVSDELTNGVKALTDLSELKSNFVQAAGTSLEKIFFININNNETIYTCFKPTSKQLKLGGKLVLLPENADKEPTTAITAATFTATGNPCTTVGTSTTGREACYYCAQ